VIVYTRLGCVVISAALRVSRGVISKSSSGGS
jgi:hypothetical protein